MHIYFLQTFVSSLFPFQTTNIFFVAQLFILPFFAKFSIFLWVSISSKPRIHTHFHWNEKPNETPTKNVHIKPNEKNKKTKEMNANLTQQSYRIRQKTKQKKKLNVRTVSHCGHHQNEKGIYTKASILFFVSVCLMWWFVLNTITFFLSCHKNKFHQFT